MHLLLALVVWVGIIGQVSEPAQSRAQSTSQPPTVSLKEGKEHLLRHLPAEYPPIAKVAHIAGTVVVGAEIDKDGAVTIVVPLSGPEMLRSAASEAVRQYKYRPFIMNGSAAVVRIPVQVRFDPFHSKSVE